MGEGEVRRTRRGFPRLLGRPHQCRMPLPFVARHRRRVRRVQVSESHAAHRPCPSRQCPSLCVSLSGSGSPLQRHRDPSPVRCTAARMCSPRCAKQDILAWRYGEMTERGEGRSVPHLPAKSTRMRSPSRLSTTPFKRQTVREGVRERAREKGVGGEEAPSQPCSLSSALPFPPLRPPF